MVRRVLLALPLVLMLVFASPAWAMADSAQDESGPPLVTPPAKLAAALHCHDTLSSASHEPVLLVHGIASTGAGSWGWNYVPALNNAGFDVCTVDLPYRALTDIQISTEYVVYAVRQMRDHYHSKVNILGHSQGALEGRWAIKFWPDIRNSVDDMIGLGAPYHGTANANIVCATGSCVPALWQFSIGSNFLKALNANDETPGNVSYTSIYSLTDNLATPQLPRSVSAQGDGATNVPIQSICPVRVVDHYQTLADAVAYAVVVDALTHPGPADPSRIDRRVCGQLFLPGVTLDSFAVHYAAIFATFVPDIAGLTYPPVSSEPPLRCYAQVKACAQ
jgi:triacylglycerol esterase/lipase EstA (alpha/beta hydrolase family)